MRATERPCQRQQHWQAPLLASVEKIAFRISQPLTRRRASAWRTASAMPTSSLPLHLSTPELALLLALSYEFSLTDAISYEHNTRF